MKYKVLLILLFKIFDFQSMSYESIKKDNYEYNKSNLLISLPQELKNKILNYIIFDLYKEATLDNDALKIFEQFDMFSKSIILISSHLLTCKDFLKTEIKHILNKDFFKLKLNETLKNLFSSQDIKCNIKKIIMLIKLGANPDIIVKYKDMKEPIIFIAIRFPEFKVLIKLLLDKGANIDIKDSFRNTPLTVASWLGYENIISVLIDHNANVNTKACDGSTALIYASWTGHKKIVEMLLSHYVGIISIDAQNFEGDTALIKAAQEGYSEIVELLLNYGANSDIANERGDTAQDLALYDITDIININKKSVLLVRSF